MFGKANKLKNKKNIKQLLFVWFIFVFVFSLMSISIYLISTNLFNSQIDNNLMIRTNTETTPEEDRIAKTKEDVLIICAFVILGIAFLILFSSLSSLFIFRKKKNKISIKAFTVKEEDLTFEELEELKKLDNVNNSIVSGEMAVNEVSNG